MKNQNYLKLSFEHDGDPNDDVGWLLIDVTADGFAGRGGMWVQWQDLLELSEKLEAFPLPKDNPIGEDWGYGGGDDYQSIISLQFSNAGNRGPVKVLVQINVEDDLELAVKCKFNVAYSSLDQFRGKLAEMAKRKAGSCLLSDG